MPPVPDFPPGREFDPRCPRVPGKISEQDARATAHKTKSLVSEANISENVELVGVTEGEVLDVFVQGNYVYLGTYSVFVILDAE